MVKRIALVGAHTEQRDLAQRALVAAGFELDAHESGEAALVAMRAQAVDALITDFTLGALGGAELAARARVVGGGRRLFVVALAEPGVAAPPSAFDEVLRKPVDLTELIALLRA